MQEALAPGSNPQTAVAIPEQLEGIELPSDRGKRVRLGFPVNQLSDSTMVHGDQECAVVALYQRLHQVWRRKEFRRPRYPSPQPGQCSHPEIDPAILIQGDHLVS